MRRHTVLLAALGIACAGLIALFVTAGSIEEAGLTLRGTVTRLIGTGAATIAVVDPETAVTVIGPEGANITVGAVIEARGRPRLRNGRLELLASGMSNAG
jgi:hypothetical protein